MIGLSAITLKGETVDVKLEDCPTGIVRNIIARVAIENSDLLYENTLVRVDKKTGITEGDILADSDKEIGWIIYSKGFYMLDTEGNIKEIPRNQHIKVKKGTLETRQKIVTSKERTLLTFKCFGSVITLGSFLMNENGFIVLKGLQHQYRSVKAEDILFMTGYETICYGEYFKSGRVTLKDGIPCVNADGNSIKLSSLL